MDIDHVHFYVDDAKTWRNWFIETLGCEAIAHHLTPHTHTEIVQRGGVCLVLSSPLTAESEVATYLQCHPPGVVDIAFRVADIKAAIAQFTQHHGILRCPLQTQTRPNGHLQWAIAQGWGDLRHTLLQWTGAPTNTLAGLRYGISTQPISAVSAAPSSTAPSSPTLSSPAP
ncbi:MAG TPA: VOC family protein, partial [Chroococcidiopsis sp.]